FASQLAFIGVFSKDALPYQIYLGLTSMGLLFLGIAIAVMLRNKIGFPNERHRGRYAFYALAIAIMMVVVVLSSVHSKQMKILDIFHRGIRGDRECNRALVPKRSRIRSNIGGLSQGLWGEAMFCYLLNRVPNLNYLRVRGCKVVVRFPDLKLKTLVSVNSIIKSRDAIFDANRLSSVHRPSLRIPNGTEDIGGSVVLEEVDMTNEFLLSKFSMKDIGEANVILAAGKEVEWLRILILKIPLWSKPIAHISVLYDSAATLAKAYSQMYNVKSRHLGFRHNTIRELITNGGGIYRGCKVDMTKEFLSSKFSMKDIGEADVILAAGKEVEWLRILIFKIPLWPKPIAHISILYDSVATLAKAYSQMYNVKSRHLGFRHNMIRDLITDGGGIYRGCKVSTKLS
nr:zinc finger, CCHC-type [Tanacetum cinerariifolium]